MIATLAAVPHIPYFPFSFSGGESPSIVLRSGTISDLESILNIGLAAMPMDPQWDYRFPYGRAFPQDQRDATRRRYQDFLEHEDNWAVSIAEIVTSSHSSPIGFAVWDISNLLARNAISRKTIAKQPAKNVRRDGDQGRMQAWNNILREAKTRHFERQYGSHQIQLQILATHPEFQRLGAGSRLVDEGIRLANASDKTISVFASPMGKRLYSSLGFIPIASIIVQAENDSEFVTVEAMVYDSRAPSMGLVKNEGTRDVGSDTSIWMSGANGVCA